MTCGEDKRTDRLSVDVCAGVVCGSPVSHLRGNHGLLLLAGRLDARLGDERLQNARVRVLGVAVVQDLVQQLVYQHKVVLDVLLRHLAAER